MADAWRQGYWRNDAGALKVAAGAGVRWHDGYKLNADNSLAITTTVAGCVMRQGHMRDANGALLTADPGVGTPKWRDGMLVDDNGALVTAVYPAAGQQTRQGYLRTPAGALVVA
jgi:hypothetical protein